MLANQGSHLFVRAAKVLTDLTELVSQWPREDALGWSEVGLETRVLRRSVELPSARLAVQADTHRSPVSAAFSV